MRVIGVVAALIALTIGCTTRETQSPPHDALKVTATPDHGREIESVFFDTGDLDDSLVDFANRAYGEMTPDYSDPDNAVGTPPFSFEKRINCEVVQAPPQTEKVIKDYAERVTLHAIIVLRDARRDLYAFTVTSTDLDNRKAILRSFGPITNENPNVVQLPISQRKLSEFPIDFNTGIPLTNADGKCVFVPYPYPADQEYWLFTSRRGQLQGLYRNDRYQSIEDLLRVIVKAIKAHKDDLKR